MFSLEGDSREREEEVRELEESSWHLAGWSVVGNIVSTTSTECVEEDPVDGVLVARTGLLVPTIMGSNDDSSEEELSVSGDWALILG